jgi:DNA-binding SARP family transcriptional activator
MSVERSLPRSSTQAIVRVFTLGRFALEVNGRPLRFAGKLPRKPLELLKALVALGGDSVPVEQLSESLWPDLDGDNAHNAFKSALGRLRKLVPDAELIQQGGRLSIAAATCWVDALVFAERLAACLRALEAGQRVAALAELNAAIALYRGPFLDGEFEPPEVLAAREKLHGQFARHLGAVADTLRDAGEAASAIGLYQRGLEIDDVSEQFCAGLMNCHARLGRTADALATYRRFRQVLEARMGVQPSAEVEALVRRLEREGALRPAADGADGPVAVEPSASAGPAAPPSGGAPDAPPQPGLGNGERRQATVAVFLVPGLTAPGEAADPEEAEAALRWVRERVQAAVERHGGVVNQFLRNEIVALFGVPAAREDDARRAVQAALELCATVRAQAGDAGGGQAPLSGSAGIDTGLVVVKPSDERGGRFAVTGAPVDRAARLAAQAGLGEILVSLETHRLVGAYFEGEMPAAGQGRQRKPAEVCRILGESAVRSRFEASAQRGLTDFAGRSEELALLRAALAKAMGGQGQVVTVLGEPGIGKTRLLHEFRQGLPRERVNALQGRCQSLGEHTPYLPLVAALRRGLQIRDTDAPQAQAQQAVAAARAIDAGLEVYLPVLLHLLSLPGEAHALPPTLKGEDLRAAIREALGALITVSARRKPLVLVLEDWHWADEASDGALAYLQGLISAAPLLLIVTTRPEGAPGWPPLSYHSQLALQPLPGAESARLAAAALEAQEVPGELAQLLHARCRGNPFFVEEVCRTLLEEGSVRIEEGRAVLTRPAEALRLPDMVQAVVRSRIDRLDETCRDVLRLAHRL